MHHIVTCPKRAGTLDRAELVDFAKSIGAKLTAQELDDAVHGTDRCARYCHCAGTFIGG